MTTTEINDLAAFLEAEGLTYRGALIELAEKILAFVVDGEGDSLPRALELTKSLHRLLDLD